MRENVTKKKSSSTEAHKKCLKKSRTLLVTSPEPEKQEFDELNDDFLARIDEDIREA